MRFCVNFQWSTASNRLMILKPEKLTLLRAFSLQQKLSLLTCVIRYLGVSICQYFWTLIFTFGQYEIFKSVDLTILCFCVDVLGNAHFTNFFVNNEDVEQLNLALRAYSQTEKQMKEPNPDLFFNRATILEYLERYGEAVRDYNAAHAIDQSLNANHKAGAIIDFVVQTCNLVQSRSASKAKKHGELAKSIPTHIEGELRFPVVEEQKEKATYAFAPIANLVNGIN